MQQIGIGIVGAAALAALACSAGRPGSAASAGGREPRAATASAAPGGAATSSAAPSGATTAGGAPNAPRQVEGRVELIDRDNEVTLSGAESAGHAFDKMKLDEGTQVTVNGEKATIADIDEGDDIRASFSQRGGELHLDRVEVLSQGE